MSTAYAPRPRPRTWREHRGAIHHPWAAPFHWIEWLTQWAAYYLSRWSFLEVLEYAGRFTVLIAVILYFMESPDRRKQKHYQAWQVVNSAQGQSGEGGRIEALQELHEDHVSLVALNVQGAYLRGMRLPGADLHRSDFSGADLRDVNFRGVNLEDANLQKANLRRANLSGASFQESDLSGSDLTEANLSGTDLRAANLSDADLTGANLRDAQFGPSTLLQGATLSGVRNAPAGFAARSTGREADTGAAPNSTVGTTQPQ